MAAKRNIGDETFRLTKQIPQGNVSTYGAIAKALGRESLARAVGRTLGKNQNPAEVPCHRVVHSDGRLGGFRWGAAQKIGLLKKEGVGVRKGRIIDFKKGLFTAFKKD